MIMRSEFGMLTFFVYATNKRIARETTHAITYRIMIDDSAVSIDTTSAWASIFTMLIKA